MPRKFALTIGAVVGFVDVRRIIRAKPTRPSPASVTAAASLAARVSGAASPDTGSRVKHHRFMPGARLVFVSPDRCPPLPSRTG
jgi:hypothetical protein